MEVKVDTVIVPARHEGFEKVFLGQHAWWAIPMSDQIANEIKYLAIYQVAPISAITYYAKISRAEKLEDSGRYAFYFDQPPISIKPIKYDVGSIVPQAHRYTTLDKLLNSKKLSDIMNKRKDYIV